MGGQTGIRSMNETPEEFETRVIKAMREFLGDAAFEALTFLRWKDGIDIRIATHGALAFVKNIEAAASAAKIDALEKALRPFAEQKMLIIGFNGSLSKHDLKDCDYIVGFKGPKQPEFKHYEAARAALAADSDKE